jgi:MFS family permease
VFDQNLFIVFGVALMAVLRADSISPAFPGVSEAFAVSSQQTALLISVFALPSIFLTPLLGMLADRWGRKKILTPSLLLFGVAGGASALAPNFDLLLGLRLVQGIGAASLSMLNITLVADLFEGERRVSAMGYNTSMRSGGSMIFPLIGGALAGMGWFYPFLLPLLAVPVALLVWFRLDNPEPNVHTNFAAYLGGAWRSMQSWRVAQVFLAGSLIFMVMSGAYLGYFPFLLADKFQAPPWMIGLLVAMRPLVTTIMASQLGRISRRWREEWLFQTALLVYASALILIPLAPSLAWMAAFTLLLGTAEGLYWPSNHSLLGKLAPLEHRAGFMAFNDMVMKIGQTVGPPLMGAVVLVGGIDVAFFTSAGILAAMFMVLKSFSSPPTQS